MTIEQTFFSNANESFTEIDHILGHQTNLNEFKKNSRSYKVYFYHN
jgi:hypothetical protein